MKGGAALSRVAAFRPHAAVIYGSGLAGMPAGATLDEEIDYAELGWPVTAVPGHLGTLRLVRVVTPGGAGLRLALACGRVHGYEGYAEDELGRAVRDLRGADVDRIVMTCSCGALKPSVRPGDVIVCRDVVDLQRPPVEAPPRLVVCGDEEAARTARVAGVPASVGTYVAVPGPQFETPAEVEWLATYGDVVGMSGAPEVRAAHGVGAALCLVALVANRAGAVESHDDVLASGAHLAARLGRAVVAVVTARWPELA